MAKGKNFAKSLGSKKLTTLIPDVEASETISTSNSPIEKKQKKTADTTVTTFRIKNDLLLSVKAVAFWERQKIQDVLNDALTYYIDSLPPATLKKAREEYEKRKS